MPRWFKATLKKMLIKLCGELVMEIRVNLLMEVDAHDA